VSADRTFDTIVIGAGVVGSSVAYHCARRGMRVCLVDRDGLGGRTTSASAGLTIVSARVPGPALEFALQNIKILTELLDTFEDEIDFAQPGGLFVAEDETEYQLLREFVRRQSAHVPLEFLEQRDLRSLEPNLGKHLIGGAYCRLDGYASPMGLAIAYARNARALGAALRLHTTVTDIVRDGRRVTGVRTTGGTIGAASVVSAAGVWSPEIGALVDVKLPVIPRKGQLLVTEPLPQIFRSVVSHAGLIAFRDHGIPAPETVKGEMEKKRYMKQASGGPFAGRVYIGSTSEFVGFDRSNTHEALADLAAYAVDTVPALARARLVRGWAGLRPRSADGKFLIGPVPGVEGFFVATGHDSNGVLHSSATGRLLAEWMATGERPALLAPFDPARLLATAT
jgi:glycine/D-amino acid oxidase-like deaminating enzyme